MTRFAFPRWLSNIKAVLAALALAAVPSGLYGGTESVVASPPLVFGSKLDAPPLDFEIKFVPPPPAFESTLSAPAPVFELDWSLGELKRILSAGLGIGPFKIRTIERVSETKLVVVVTSGNLGYPPGGGMIVTLSFENGTWRITKKSCFVH